MHKMKSLEELEAEASQHSEDKQKLCTLLTRLADLAANMAKMGETEKMTTIKNQEWKMEVERHLQVRCLISCLPWTNVK